MFVTKNIPQGYAVEIKNKNCIFFKYTALVLKKKKKEKTKTSILLCRKHPCKECIWSGAEGNTGESHWGVRITLVLSGSCGDGAACWKAVGCGPADGSLRLAGAGESGTPWGQELEW